MYIDTPEKQQQIDGVLNREFRGSELKTVPGKGTNKYVEGNNVIDRLNEAFTAFVWSFRCPTVDTFEDIDISTGKPKRQVSVYGELTIHVEFVHPDGHIQSLDVVKGQWGSKDMSPDRNDRVTMEHGDGLKSASTDALKKCATLLGIANHLSRKVGDKTLEPGVAEITAEMVKTAKAKGYTINQMLDFCSGVTRKTIIQQEDLSLTQAQACATLMKDMPSIKAP